MRLTFLTGTFAKSWISIHAPRERCDGKPVINLNTSITFQSTHRVSDATFGYKLAKARVIISIHAPRERCDAEEFERNLKDQDFNPRTA